jgi:hypothetical protein
VPLQHGLSSLRAPAYVSETNARSQSVTTHDI